jgi:hypothetical protein
MCELCDRGIAHQCQESGAFENAGRGTYREDPPKGLALGDNNPTSHNNDANTRMLHHSAIVNAGIPTTFHGLESVKLPARIV